jgi:hypothetical protein
MTTYIIYLSSSICNFDYKLIEKKFNEMYCNQMNIDILDLEMHVYIKDGRDEIDYVRELIENMYKVDIEMISVIKWDGFWHPNNYGYEISNQKEKCQYEMLSEMLKMM